MVDSGFGQMSRQKHVGLLDWDQYQPKSKKACSDAHKKNPNFKHNTYKYGQYGAMTFEEQFRVNTQHKLTEEQAVYLPMNKRLARHFALHASQNALKKLQEQFSASDTGEFDLDAVMKHIEQEEQKDAVKQNAMTGMDRMKNKIKDKEDKQRLAKEDQDRQKREKQQAQATGEAGADGEAQDRSSPKKKNAKMTYEQIQMKNQEVTPGLLIKYVTECIAREERDNMGMTGKRKLLSFKEKFKLLRDFLDLRANPHKNRVFQMTKAKIEENRKKKEAWIANDQKVKSMQQNSIAKEKPSLEVSTNFRKSTTTDATNSPAKLQSSAQKSRQVNKAATVGDIKLQSASFLVDQYQDDLKQGFVNHAKTKMPEDLSQDDLMQPQGRHQLRMNSQPSHSGLLQLKENSHSQISQQMISGAKLADMAKNTRNNANETSQSPPQNMFSMTGQPFMLSNHTNASVDFEAVEEEVLSKALTNRKSQVFSQSTAACYTPMASSNAELLTTVKREQIKQINSRRCQLKSQEHTRRQNKRELERDLTKSQIEAQNRRKAQQRLYAVPESKKSTTFNNSQSVFHPQRVLQERIMSSHTQNREKQRSITTTPKLTANRNLGLSSDNRARRLAPYTVSHTKTLSSQAGQRHRGTIFSSTRKSFNEVEIPADISDKVEVNYQNVLPSNLRQGNNNVMPLIPPKLDGISKQDYKLLKNVLQKSSYTMAQWCAKEPPMYLTEKQLLKRQQKEESQQEIKSKIKNVQNRRFVKDAQQKLTTKPKSIDGLKSRRRIQTLITSTADFEQMKQDQETNTFATEINSPTAQKQQACEPGRSEVQHQRHDSAPLNAKRTRFLTSPKGQEIQVTVQLSDIGDAVTIHEQRPNERFSDYQTAMHPTAFLRTTRQANKDAALLEAQDYSSQIDQDQMTVLVQDAIELLVPKDFLVRYKANHDGIAKQLSKFVLHVLESKNIDPKELQEQLKRAKKLKKSSLQQQFSDETEEQDNAKIMSVLQEVYEGNNQVRRAMEQHMDLMDTMAQSDTIKNVEKHQRKSLRQIRSIIMEIVMKRKLRDNFGTQYVQPSLGKPTDLADIRELTKRNNATTCERITNEIQRFAADIGGRNK